MSRRIITQVVDDLDGTVLDAGTAESVEFGLDGHLYQIDLSTQHANELRAALEPYIAAARQSKTQSSRPASGHAPRGPAQEKEIRSWAKSYGYTVASRGRIPADILEVFYAAH